MLRFPLWFRRMVAGPELAELHRWRVAHGKATQWLVEFPDARDALQWMGDAANGNERITIYHLRDLATARAERVRGARLTDHRIDL